MTPNAGEKFQGEFFVIKPLSRLCSETVDSMTGCNEGA